MHQKRRIRHGACALSLHTVNKQTVDRETENNKKKMKMASARKPELLVWTVYEVELLLRLTLNYKASKLQERLDIFCGTNTSMLSAIVVMRHRGVGRWRHRFGKYVDSPSTWKWEGCVFGFLHPETRFQKGVFSGAAFSGMEVDGRPKWCNTCACCVVVWTGPKCHGTGIGQIELYCKAKLELKF